MKQLTQSLKTGEAAVVDAPVPAAMPGRLIVQSHRTLVSAGTERMLVDFGRSGWLSKARSQPERVKEVLRKIQTDGLAATYEAVNSKLDQPLAPGYCNVGHVIAVGAGISSTLVGKRVVSNGPHAEFVSVPANLCAEVPDNVVDDSAAFVVLGAIALQGARLAAPTIGEKFVVMGLGLVGLLTVQILRANGCQVLAVDVDPGRLEMASRFGAKTAKAGPELLAAAEAFSQGRGVDGVMLTLSSKDSDPVSIAAKMCRKRGRIILVGVTGLSLNRGDFYEKELTFQVSCSYGPGRYDPLYEDKGQDYPFGFVRWTEQRNFEAVLDLLADGKIEVDSLITHRFPIDQASAAYELLVSGSPSLGILLEYAADVVSPLPQSVQLPGEKTASPDVGTPKVSFIGAGNYATRTLMPAFRAAGVELDQVVTTGGVNGLHYGKKFGFAAVTTDTANVLSGQSDMVVIATRHDSHAQYVVDALAAGKHVFVEKPLCLTFDELQMIEAACANTDAMLMVGFNRRFAPLVQQINQMLATHREPKAMVMTVNAGDIPAEHWTQDPAIGGGRIIGEACHFIDLVRFLAGCEIEDCSALNMRSDVASLALKFVDGSIATIHYLANGHRSFPKERLEVFAGGRILQLDNFRRLTGYGWRGFKAAKSWQQDKGHRACVAAFVDAVKSGAPSPIPFSEILEVSRVAIELGRS